MTCSPVLPTEIQGSNVQCATLVVRDCLSVNGVEITGGGGGGAPFALLHFDWTAGVVLSQANIASVSRPVADNGANFVGVRDFTFTTPIDNVNRAIITANVRAPIFWPFPEPPALRGPPVSAFPGLQCFAALESTSVLRVWVYRCSDNVNPLFGLMSEEAQEVWVHVARVST